MLHLERTTISARAANKGLDTLRITGSYSLLKQRNKQNRLAPD